jgi:hypothetical protein
VAPELGKPKPENSSDDRDGVVAKATAIAKAKSMRLRLIKARHENYLAERREERETDEDVTKELSVDYETVNRRA